MMWADNACTGLADWARNNLDLTFKVVKKPPNQVGLEVGPGCRCASQPRQIQWALIAASSWGSTANGSFVRRRLSKVTAASRSAESAWHLQSSHSEA